MNEKALKILVTGGCGSIGTSICQNLLKSGHQPTVFSRNPKSPSSINGDITKIDHIKHIIDLFDGVIHAAALKNGETKQIIETNIVGTLNILECSKNLNFVKVISSSEAHSRLNAVYGTTKFLCEEICKSYKNAHTIRIPTVLGSEQGFVNNWINDAKSKNEIQLYIFNGKPKKKFFMTLDEAGKVCSCLDKYQNVHYRVIDAGVVAKIISEKTGCKIVEIEKSGINYEHICNNINNEKTNPISEEETKIILEGIYGL